MSTSRKQRKADSMRQAPGARIVGFTGTRNGMTIAQYETVMDLVTILRSTSPLIAVHGDCVGADKDFDDICASQNIPRNIRPCTFECMRAHCEERGARVVDSPKRPMQRNRNIVSDAEILISCPLDETPVERGSGSGTWATIRFAKRKRIAVHIIGPDGRPL